MTSTSTSCPRCGAGTPAGAARCAVCGFVFFDEPHRRALARPSWHVYAGVLALLAAGAGGVALATHDAPAEAPAPVPAARAERSLERRLEGAAGEPGSVRCRGPVRPARATRCERVFGDGDTQLMLVGLDRAGGLTITVPYPAQRRSGD